MYHESVCILLVKQTHELPLKKQKRKTKHQVHLLPAKLTPTLCPGSLPHCCYDTTMGVSSVMNVNYVLINMFVNNIFKVIS